MIEAGFEDVRRLDGRFFQPLILGSKRPWREADVGASCERVVSLDGPEDSLREMLLDLEEELAGSRPGWRLMRRGEDVLEYTAPIGFGSWGESIRIALEGESVRVRSACRFPLQIIDWGRNRGNVECVREAIRRVEDVWRERLRSE
jgi:hypothetical protein